MEESPSRSILLTGLPTFAARRMLRLLIETEPQSRIWALIPHHAYDAFCAAHPSLPARVHALHGSPTAIDLGLSGDEYTSLITEITDVYHLSSEFRLHATYREAFHENVRGLEGIIRAASEMPRLKRFNHFSTAYVAGDREGVILEDELDVEQRFRNAFERTKFEAEQLAKHWQSKLPLTIYRPSFIVGDSQTGEIDRSCMDGPYVLMRAMLHSPVDIPLPLPGRGDKPFNMVPVDWVCRTLYHLSLHPEAEGKTFHLTDPNPMSARRFFELVAEHAKRRPPKGRLPYRLSRFLLELPMMDRIMPRHKQFFADFNQLTLFNCMNTLTLLSNYQDAICPPLPSYIGSLVTHIREEARLPGDP